MVCVNQKTFRQLLSGTDRRPGANVLRLTLRLIAVPYACAVAFRNRLYDHRLLKTVAASVPVISVGNITTGGTGKTPLVIWLCRYLESQGRRCAILTRGYKTQRGQLSDEPALLAGACTNTTVVVDPDRAAGAHKAVSQYGADVLVLDDGFQHRRLGRDVNIVTLDATCPFGYERVLPAGLLREPLEGLKRAEVIVITRYDQVEPQALQRLETRIGQLAPHVSVVKTACRHTHAVTTEAAVLSLESLRHQRAFVFCGIGNPDAFIESVRHNGINIVGTRIFNDHYRYKPDDIHAIIRQAKQSSATVILCTEKDGVKAALLKPEEADIQLAWLAMELDFAEGVDKLKTHIDTVLGPSQDKSRVPENKTN